MAFFIDSNIRLYIEDGITVHKLSIQSDFTYNRSGRINSVNRESMDPSGDRSVIPIIDEVGPITFSFSTYAEVDDTAAIVTSAQKLLWRGLAGTANALDEDTSRFLVNFGSSADIPTLNPLSIYVEYLNTGKVIKLTNATIDRVTMDMRLDSMLNMTWKGTALGYEESSAPSVDKDYTVHSNCIITKLSTITLLRNAVNYNLALTGGRVEINNNNVYYTRNQFARSKTTIGHYTGARQIQGSLDFYTKTGTNASYDLYDAIMTDAITDTTTDYSYDLETIADIQITIGDASGYNIQLELPETILNLPTQRYRNTVTMSVPFLVKESTGKEFQVKYNI